MTSAVDTKLSLETGQALLSLARHSIAEQLEGDGNLELLNQETKTILEAPILQEKRGTFVTLHKHGALRGCIGSLTSEEPLVDNVKHNAVNAAFRDPRFPPLSQDELPEVSIEVSILSQPAPLNYSGPEQLLEILKADKPGLIVKKGFKQATFLPQVWSQLPQAEDFLGHLCLKAGLPQEAWRSGDLEILVYHVQDFSES